MRCTPGFALITIMTLALGIEANTAIFPIVEAIPPQSLCAAAGSRTVQKPDRDRTALIMS
jgi:ABC-type nitrate/sulfonate/bicarbonate transport system permease component